MSFSAEMKDFLNAYDKVTGTNVKNQSVVKSQADTDETVKRTARENDPTRLATADKLAQLRVQKAAQDIAHAGTERKEAAALSDATTKFYNSQAANKALMPTSTPGIVGAPSPTPTTVPFPAALPTEVEVINRAEGGIIPTGDEDEEEQAAPTVPASVPRPAIDTGTVDTGGAGGYDIGAQRRPAGGTRSTRTPQEPEIMASGAIRGGYEYAGRLLGSRGGIKTPEQLAQAKAIAAGQGGFSDEEMRALGKSVDPEGKLSESTRNMVALGSMYQYWQNKGDPEKAQRVAFQLLQNYRSAATRYAALAARAAENGDMDTATKAMLKAHANVPDGRDMALQRDPDDPNKLVYSFTDENGKTILSGITTPKELAAQAMGLAKGGFDKAILTAAGQREAKAQAGGVTGAGAERKNPQTASDLKAQGELVDTEVDKLGKAWLEARKKEGGSETEVPPNFTGDVADAANFVLQNNLNAKKQLTPREAAQAGLWLSQPGSKDPEKPDFKVEVDMEDDLPTGNSTVKFRNGLSINLPTERLQPMLDRRQERVNNAKKQINDKMEASEKPGFLSTAAAAYDDDIVKGGMSVARAAGRGREAVQDVISENVVAPAAERLKKTGEAAGQFFDWVGKKAREHTASKAIPDTIDDRPGD